MTREEKWQKDHCERVAQMPSDVRDAHVHCRCNALEIGQSDLCGCFYCLQTFTPADIRDWVTERPRYNDLGDLISEEGSKSAMCPRCGIDSVIGSAAGFPLTADFLGRMKSYWF